MLAADYPVSVICEVVALPRSSYYYRTVECDETSLHTALEQAAAKFPTYGSRRLTEQVKRDTPELSPLGRKRVRRVMRDMRLTVRRKKERKQTTDSKHSFPRHPNLVKDLVVTHPNQVWVCDRCVHQNRQRRVCLPRHCAGCLHPCLSRLSRFRTGWAPS